VQKGGKGKERDGRKKEESGSGEDIPVKEGKDSTTFGNT